MNLRLSILRCDIFIFVRTPPEELIVFKWECLPIILTFLRSINWDFRMKNVIFWKILRLSWKDKYEKRCGLGVLFHGLKHFISFRELIPKNSKIDFLLQIWWVICEEEFGKICHFLAFFKWISRKKYFIYLNSWKCVWKLKC